MCQPGKPCDHVLAAVRAAIAEILIGALATIQTEAVLSVHDDAQLLQHIHAQMQTRDVDRIGRSLLHALLAEHVPEHVALLDAASEVRGALMRRITGASRADLPS